MTQSNLEDAMSEVLFEVQGKPVRAGDQLWVHPSREARAGTRVKAFRVAVKGEALMRSENGAVPTVPIDCLSWSPWALNLVGDARKEATGGETNRTLDMAWADAIAWAVANPEKAQAIVSVLAAEAEHSDTLKSIQAPRSRPPLAF